MMNRMLGLLGDCANSAEGLAEEVTTAMTAIAQQEEKRRASLTFISMCFSDRWPRMTIDLSPTSSTMQSYRIGNRPVPAGDVREIRFVAEQARIVARGL